MKPTGFFSASLLQYLFSVQLISSCEVQNFALVFIEFPPLPPAMISNSSLLFFVVPLNLVSPAGL